MKKSLGPSLYPLPAPAWVIGTYDSAGKPNMMTAAWTGIVCSRPPSIGVSLQKIRYSYDNIVQRRAFTVNIPSAHYVQATDYFGIASGRDEDKLAASGLTAVCGDFVDAPYLKEFPAVFECQLLQTVEIGLHTQFIGEIKDFKVEAEFIGPNGKPMVDALDLFIWSDTYRRVGEPLAPAFSIGKRR